MTERRRAAVGLMTALSLGLALVFGGGSASAAESVVIPKVRPGEPLPADLFIQLAKAVNPAVVNISTTYMPRRSLNRDPFFELFEPFMGPSPYGQMAPQQSLGTGFLIRDDGLIVTNNHVIDRADVIKVQISEKTKETFDAKLVGKDAKTDIALIKIDAKRKLPFVQLGSSSDVQVGEWVAAFGNPYGYGHTMTKGIISAVGREIDELNLFPFMQTDASINPGNSGGPLVNTSGLVIGVNTAIDARAQGIGFVIPIDNVKSILPQLEKEGTIPRGFIGIQMADIDEEGAATLHLKATEGALVTQILPSTPAEASGLQPYDLIVEFAGHKISSTRELSKTLAITPVNKQVEMKVIRNGKPKSLAIKVGSPPDLKTLRAEGPATGANRGEGLKPTVDVGFLVADYSTAIAAEFGLPKLSQPRPVLLMVEPNSVAARAGLAPGDIILDVNRQSTSHARDVVHALRAGTVNIFRVLKQDRVVLIPVRAP